MQIFFADFVINYWVQCFVSQVWDGGAGRWFWDQELLGLCPAWNHRREAVPTAFSSGRENRGQRGRWGQCLHIPKSKFSTIVILKPPKNHDFPLLQSLCPPPWEYFMDKSLLFYSPLDSTDIRFNWKKRKINKKSWIKDKIVSSLKGGTLRSSSLTGPAGPASALTPAPLRSKWRATSRCSFRNWNSFKTDLLSSRLLMTACP